MPSRTLYDAARGVLDASLAALAAEGLSAPSRSYVSVGQAAFDCDQLVVWVDPVEPYRRPEPNPAARRGGPKVAQASLIIERARCVPVPASVDQPPPAAVIDAEALALYQDAWTIYRGLEQRLQPEWTGDPLLGGACRPAGLEGMKPIEPGGGVWGWHFLLRVQLDSEGWWPGAT